MRTDLVKISLTEPPVLHFIHPTYDVVTGKLSLKASGGLMMHSESCSHSQNRQVQAKCLPQIIFPTFDVVKDLFIYLLYIYRKIILKKS